MPQRTDIFDLGAPRAHAPARAAGSTSHVRVDAVRLRRPSATRSSPTLVPVRLDVSRTTRQRLGAAAALRGRARGPVHALPGAGARRRSRSTRARSTSPGGGEELQLALRRRDGELDLAAWARDALALALPAQITVPRRTAPACARSAARTSTSEPGARARGASPTRAGRSCRELKLRLGRALATLLRRPWPSPSRSSRTRARTSAASQHKITAPTSTRARSATSRAGRTACARLRLLRRSRGRRTCTTTTTTTTTSPRPHAEPVTVAVDANGADLGPAEVARGAARGRRSAASRVLAVRPGRRDRRRRPTASRSSTRRSRSPRRPTPRAPCARTPDASIVQAVARRRRRARRRARLRRLDRRRAGRRRCSTSSARAASTARRWRSLVPGPGRAVPAARRGRQRRGAARAPRPVRPHGRGVHGGRAGRRSARAWRCSPTARRPTQGHARTSSPRTRALARAPGGPELRRQRRGLRDRRPGAADVVVTDGFTGNVALKVMEGDVGGAAAARSATRRCRRTRAQARRRCCCAPALRGAARRDRPRGAGRRVPARPAPARRRRRTARSARAGFARAIEVAARGVREDVVGPHARARSRRRARCAGAGRPRRPLACPTSHDPRRGPRR